MATIVADHHRGSGTTPALCAAMAAGPSGSDGAAAGSADHPETTGGGKYLWLTLNTASP